MRAMLVREFKEGWRSFRIPGLLLIAVFFAITDPPIQKYMEQIVEMFAQGIEISLPPGTADMAFVSFLDNMSQIFLIAAIILTMSLVARDRRVGITEWFLSRPISRRDYIVAKAGYLISSVTAIAVISAVVCALFANSLMGGLTVAGVFYSTLMLITQLMIPLTLTLLVSALSGSSGAAAAAGMGSLFLFPLINWATQASTIDWLPWHLGQHARLAVYGNISSSYWVAVALSWGIVVGLIVAMHQGFKHKAL